MQTQQLPLRLDFLSISIKEEHLNALTEMIQKVFSGTIEKRPNAFDIFQVSSQSNIAIIHFTNAATVQVQFEGSFFVDANSFSKAQECYEWLRVANCSPRIRRCDLAIDFIGISVGMILPIEKVDPKRFVHGKSLKTAIFGNPPETIYVSHRHYKIRIYDRVKRAQHLVGKFIAKTKDHEFLAMHAGDIVSRVEFELRADFCNYADQLMKLHMNEEVFLANVLSHFLSQNRMIDEVGETDELWKILDPLNSQYQRIGRYEYERSSRRFDDLSRSFSFIANKIRKWGLSPEEAFDQLWDALGLNNPIIGMFSGSPTYASRSYLAHKASEAGAFVCWLPDDYFTKASAKRAA
ncbi:hypothetical protein [Bdellovibrio bacteriovorus]|uniref:hypothetical protein n=1 Tax=Bdellovibrio bacteriovorus TaxID=959 RepID=UPI0035A7258D